MPPESREDDSPPDSLQDLFDGAPCGYIFTTPDGTFTRVNQTFLDLTGYEREELLRTRHLQQLLSLPSRMFYENQFAPLLRLQGFVKEVAFDLLHKSGEPLPVLVNAVLRTNERGDPLEVATTIAEATDRRTYERELLLARRKAEQLATVVTASKDAILSALPDGQIQTWNPGAERLFGLPPIAFATRTIGDLLPDLADPTEWQRILAQLTAGESVSIETTATNAVGAPLYLSVGLAPHFGQLRELISLSLIIRDVSDRHALDRQKDEFLATVSHDLKNPVAGIKGWSQILRRRTARLPEDEQDRWREDLTTIETTAGRMAAMIDELMDLAYLQMSRPLALRRKEIDLVALARRVATENEQLTDDHTLVVETSLDSLIGLWDGPRLERAVGNLVTNAVKYSPDGGQVTIILSVEEAFAVLRVKDQGLGIPAEDRPRVFERFFRSRNVADTIAGTGIGLAGAKQLVDQHGGSIEVESSGPEGSTFVLRLPLTEHS